MSSIAITLLVIGIVSAVYATRYHHHFWRSDGLAGKSEVFTIAPDFSLPDLKGRSVKLSSFHGKVVLLDYWATWCAPCKIEIPRLIELQKKYDVQGLQVIGISMDDGPEPVSLFAHEFGINYPIVMGDVKVAEAYGGVLGLPVAFLIDRQGRIYRKLVGDAAMQSLEPDVRRLLQQP